MLVNFKFKNFLSFKDENSFTMKAKADKSHEENLIDTVAGKVSKARIIYGANASGKTSFIRAIEFVKAFVFNSNNMLNNFKIAVRPFKFIENANNIPSEFELTFVKDSIKYIYAFSCTKERVVSEKLDIFYTSKATNIFERSNTTEYKFNIKDVKELSQIVTKNLDNKLFLVTLASWNYEKAKPVVDYILNDLQISYNNNSPSYSFDTIITSGEYEDYKAFCLRLLNNADLSISNITYETTKVKNLPNNNGLNNFIKVLSNGNEDTYNQIMETNAYTFKTHHIIENQETKKEYVLAIQEESYGTQELFNMTTLLYKVFKDGNILFIDEIDRSLHPLLVEYLVKLFLDADININNAQLVANTHDTNLLNLDVFRRDEIWFTERDYKSGATELYSLADFSPRKNENIEKAYLLGRFGAIPFINGD